MILPKDIRSRPSAKLTSRAEWQTNLIHFLSFLHLSPSSPDLSWKAVKVATGHSRSDIAFPLPAFSVPQPRRTLNDYA
ncbi:hypothetical protein K443DRAFT_677537 [Laccaria amethystina LaAM-08-1]|uniref:Uncharacterized protein n=1 Tax=Laccaria amethystina LaAM-08-1 TaxID=1095629 RepID=A0A0C9XLN3_9AGAR|nr:hypothetical protein K443DRAFT_677537 [Laccaria amethystina LaAM-08-1]